MHSLTVPHSYFLSSSHKVLVRSLYGKVTVRNSEGIVEGQTSPVISGKGDIKQLSGTMYGCVVGVGIAFLHEQKKCF